MKKSTSRTSNILQHIHNNHQSDKIVQEQTSLKYLERSSIEMVHMPTLTLKNQILNFSQKLVHRFLESKHQKTTTTSIFNLRQGNLQTMNECMISFAKATIGVSNPNQEIFMEAFHNNTKV